MLAISATLALFDMTEHALVLVSLEEGHVLHRFCLDGAMRPLALSAHGDRVYLLATNTINTALYTLSSVQPCLDCLTCTLPAAEHVCLAPDTASLYLSGKRHIWHLDLQSLQLTDLIAIDQPAHIATGKDRLYCSVTTTNGTLFSMHTLDGTRIDEHLLSGIVTTLRTQDNIGYLPFTQSPLHGEGLYILDLASSPPTVTTVSVAPRSARALSAYPYSVLIQNDIIYLVCEGIATITRIDAHTHRLLDCIPLGHSITNLYALPDPRFALATSNMFADLLLVDLINARLLTLSICPHEIFRQLAVLPQ